MSLGLGGGLPYLAGTSALLCGQMEGPGLVHLCPHFFLYCRLGFKQQKSVVRLP